MPKNCKECMFYRFRKNEPAQNYCKLNKCATNVDLKHFCPLKEYPENKDMSWKELVEKIKKIKFVCLGKNKKWFYIAFGGYSIEFHNDGTIFLSCEHSFNLFENKKPFEMWQIIKALVGEK